MHASANTPNRRPLLWGCALVLGGLLLSQLFLGGRASDEARAGVVSHVGGYIVLTAEATNEDILLILDNRSEEVYVYRTDARNGVELYQKLSVPQLFAEARARAQGQGRP